jgi:hypothetical protein
VKIGDCFMMPVPPKYTVPHLWIIISDPGPDGSILIVNATHDWQRAGKEYILPAGCHRRITDDSYVNFPDALAVTPNRIQALVGTLVTIERPLKPTFVAEIIGVAKVSRSMSKELKALL